jgi:hypothetical protein
MTLKVLKLRDLIESPHGVPDPDNLPDTKKIYKLQSVIDAAGRTIGFPDEIEIVVEVTEITP